MEANRNNFHEAGYGEKIEVGGYKSGRNCSATTDDRHDERQRALGLYITY
jgi:hypothetical protein